MFRLKTLYVFVIAIVFLSLPVYSGKIKLLTTAGEAIMDIVEERRKSGLISELDKIGSFLYKKSKDFIDDFKVERPSSDGKEVIKSLLRSGVSATAASAAASNASPVNPAGVSFNVETNVDSPVVRIMNITNKYEAGIELSPGVYDIEVSKDNYRTTRFWIEIDESLSGDEFVVDVSLNKIGVDNCKDDVEIALAIPAPIQFAIDKKDVLVGTGLDNESTIAQAKVTFKDAFFTDIILSFSRNGMESNYSYVISDTISNGYASFITAAPAHLTKKDILENRVKEFDKNRFVLTHTTIEQVGNNVRLVSHSFVPPGGIPQLTKNNICMMYRDV
jgi:hypothetical protein